MFNKKHIAVALAAAFSTSTFAAVNLDVTTSQTVVYASEVVVAGAATAEATNASNLLDVTTKLGFSIAADTSKYVRFDFTNAAFATGSTVSFSVAGATVAVSAGGAAGDDFVIYEVSADTADIGPGALVTLAASAYDISTTAASTVQYRLYETATAAANATDATLKTASAEFTDLASASTGEFAVAINNQATVSSEFKEFSSASLGATTATVGYLDTDLLVKTAYDLDGTLVTATDLLDDQQDVVFTGDFTFGTWTLEADDNCNASSPLSIVPTATGGIIEDLDDTALASADWYVCVDSEGDTIEKGTYSVTLADDEISDNLGVIGYDTTTIEVPYLTTFSEYNQRLYLINNGSSPADYSISFVGESMTTITPLAGAQGTVPAGEMLMLKVTDIVELEGRTRVSATVEVEGIDANIQAATQTVNLADGTTDTVVLNANSITSPSN
ncbi:hypothetical protein BM527_16605 [Alteromonas sp. Mex14]|nr:hypothetical protein BM527_16605 [Alteromonas sp. Mex14]